MLFRSSLVHHLLEMLDLHWRVILLVRLFYAGLIVAIYQARKNMLRALFMVKRRARFQKIHFL